MRGAAEGHHLPQLVGALGLSVPGVRRAAVGLRAVVLRLRRLSRGRPWQRLHLRSTHPPLLVHLAEPCTLNPPQVHTRCPWTAQPNLCVMHSLCLRPPPKPLRSCARRTRNAAVLDLLHVPGVPRIMSAWHSIPRSLTCMLMPLHTSGQKDAPCALAGRAQDQCCSCWEERVQDRGHHSPSGLNSCSTLKRR